MFNQLKDRFAEKLRNTLPADELDRAITNLIEHGSREVLAGPDWAVNMQLVDLVNNNPEVASEKLCRIVNRTIAKPVVRTQVLALTMLDTCMRNCHPVLHHQLAQSLLWSDMLKLVQDTSVTRIDLEVRDRILTMVEDYGTHLTKVPAFVQAYESLVDQGVDFPVRSPDEILPIEPYVPPEPVMRLPSNGGGGSPHGMPATATGPVPSTGGGTATSTAKALFNNLMNTLNPDRAAAAAAASVGSPAAMAAVGQGHAAGGAPGVPLGQGVPVPQRRQRGGGVPIDPSVLQGLSEEDRAAVEKAMAEMALEVESAQEAAAIAASLQATGAQQQEAGGDTRPAQGGVAAAVQLPEDNAEALQVMSSSVSLFSEMVGGIPDEEPAGVRDPLIRDLADQCSVYRSRLAMMAGELTDEEQLVQALGLNDTLGTAMARYDALMAQALSQPPPLPTTASDTAVRAAQAASAIIAPVAPEAAASTFTLLDEEEEDGGGMGGAGQQLVTRRQQAGPGAIPTSTPPTAAGTDLLDLLDGPAPPAAPTPAGPPGTQALPHVDLAHHEDSTPAAAAQPPAAAKPGSHEGLI